MPVTNMKPDSELAEDVTLLSQNFKELLPHFYNNDVKETGCLFLMKYLAIRLTNTILLYNCRLSLALVRYLTILG